MSNQIVISSGAKVRSLNGVITGTTGVLDSLPINAANGIPQLDVNGKILVSQLPNSVMEYKGTWNANTNTPTLTNGGAFNQGDVYLCNVAGTTDFGAGPIAFVVGDQVIYSGSIWQRASGSTGTVTSVAVTETGDALTITGSPITTSGTINVGFAGTSAQYVAGNGALVTFPTLTGYVPYTGATANVDLGLYNLYAQNVFANDTSGNWLASLTRDSFTAIGILALKSNGFTNYLQPLTTVSSARTWSLPNASGTIALTSDLTGGTVTSVGLTMPVAFNVASSPITTSGTLAVTAAGFASQYIRGDGTLADFPSSGGGGSSVSYYLNGGTSQGVIGGTTYYEMSKTADTGTGVDFPKTGNGLIVSFLTDANDPAQLTIPSGNWNYEIYVSMSANGGTPQLYAELYKYDGTTFTLISTSTNEILYDGTTLNLYTFAMAVPTTTLTITDRLAIKLYATNSGGKTTTVHTQNGHLCQVITTFSTGITALNGLTTQVQYLATGTSGTDFNISSATATHTFNLPTASAANRGALSSADWTTFNNKQSTLSLTTTGNSGSATLVSNTLNVPTYTLAGLGGISLTSLSATTPLSYNNTTGAFSIQVANTSQDGYLSSTDWNTFNGKQNTITNPVTGTGTSGQVTYFNGTSSVTSSSSFKFDGTNLTIGNPSSALAQLHIYNASAAASFLLQTNSTTDYSEIAVRNNSSTATSYFRQYSTATTGSDFGISRAGLALFFSNYATNFAIGTRNGGDLILGTNDIERARVLSSNGYFGLGTSTPSYLLDVNGTGRFSGALSGTSATFSGKVESANPTSNTVNLTVATGYNFNGYQSYWGTRTGTAFDFNLDVYNSGTQITALKITQAGAASFSSSVEVGAGTYSSGLAKLYTDSTYGTILTGKSGSSSDMLLTDRSGNIALQIINNGSTPNVIMNSGGNVGIGISSPSKLLTVRSLDNNTTTFAGFYALNETQGTEIWYGGIQMGGSNAAVDLNLASKGTGYISFKTDSAEKMRIGSTANRYDVMIGITSPLQPANDRGTLTVNGTSTSLLSLGAGGVLKSYYYVSTSGTIIENIAVGTALSVYSGGTGGVTLTSGATSWASLSDERLKNINGNIENAVEKLMTLRAVNFRWEKDKTNKENLGLIAQDVEKVFPQVIEKNKLPNTPTNPNKDENEYLAVKYTELIPVLVKAIQEQQQQIEELKLKIK